MIKIFLDKKKTKNFEQIKDNKFRLLVIFFFRVLRNNKILFLISSLLAASTALINYNVGLNVRNAFFTPSDSFRDSTLKILNDVESIDDLKTRLEVLKTEKNIENSEKIDAIVKDLNLNNKEDISINKEELQHLFKKHLIDNKLIYDKNLTFTFNFIFFSFSKNLIWKDFIISFILFLVFVKAPFSLCHWYWVSYSCDKIENDLKVELFKILTNSNYEKSSEISWKMLTQFTSDLDNIAVNIWKIPNRLIYVIISIFLNFYFGFQIEGRMNGSFIGIIFFLFLSLLFVVSILLKKAIKLGIKAKKRYEEDNRIIFERVKNLEYIKNNSSEFFEQQKISDRLDKTFRNNKTSLLWTALFQTLPNYLLIPNIPYLFMMIVTVINNKDKVLNLPEFIFGNFIDYFFTVQRLNSEVNKILDAILTLEDLSSDLSIVTESVLKLTDEDKEYVEETYDFDRGDIVIDNISFVYPSRPDNKIIENLSFIFEEGKKYGIAGKNGIGKSTITKILLKLYKISDGKVLISGRSLDEIKTKNLHEKICHLTNRPTFFNMSIAENVLYPFAYDKDKDLKKLIFAAKKTKIFNFISSLSSGFDTILKENGTDLSEGQKQQLEAMKVFLRDYNLYIFDEILSNVHPVTRGIVLKNIFDEIKDKTVITIDHHYDVFNHMDYVYTFSSKRLSKVKSHKKPIEKEKTDNI
ncbi:MAG: Vitamin B12 import ATP-binding protein BtuD [Mycoplasmataceae bacterium]|nr:MAG: Vitamin B12 import ATP-binding protein BtuD [Mycoplasmataceae bacterium]